MNTSDNKNQQRNKIRCKFSYEIINCIKGESTDIHRDKSKFCAFPLKNYLFPPKIYYWKASVLYCFRFINVDMLFKYAFDKI